MSTKNKARKSTGGRGVANRGASNNKTQRGRKSTNSSFSLQRLPSTSSSDSEAPTQPLNIQGYHSSAGTSGINRKILESSDSDPDGPPQKKRGQTANQTQNTQVIESEESTSSSSTTDSDEIPGREIEKEKRIAKVKKKKVKSQPATRRKIRKRSSSAETERNEEVSQSSILKESLSQGRNVISLANKCVYFLLIADQKKYAIKKSDILKHVFINHDRKLYGAVIEEANNILKKTYGMEILASEKRKGEYILINILNRDLGVQNLAELNSVDLQKRGLIFYLLTVIFMNERSISENDLWEAMKPLGIDATAKLPHPVFGDVKKYLTNELVKQMYLEYKCICKDPPEFEFTWGERARQEIDKKDILDFACKIIGDTKPEEWILQYKDAMDTGRPEE